MKKHLFLAASLVATMALYADYTQTLPLTYEDFFRAEAINASGDSLERGAYTGTDQASVSIIADQWNRSGKSADQYGKNPVVQTNTLSYGAYVDNLAGKEIVLENLGSSGSDLRSSIYSLKSNYDYSGNTYYLAALINVSSASGKGDVLAFDGNYTANAQRARLFIQKASSTQFCLGLGWNDDPTTYTGGFDFNTTHLVVIKITPVNSSDANVESATLYVDPDLDKDEEHNTALDTVTGNGLKSIRGITVRQRVKVGAKLAGLRFGTSWADVVKKAVSGLPALETPVVGTASAIGSEEFTANWTAVENAAGYKVRVYSGDDEIANKTVDEGTSVEFYNLAPSAELTYTVTALGDMVNYDNSVESAKSAAFSTTAAPDRVLLLPDADEWTASAKDKGAYAAGSFPTSHVNGFDFVQTYIERSKDDEGKSFSITDSITGERFTSRVYIDKQKNAAWVALPAVASAVRVDIYANAGSDGKKLEVQQYNYATGAWVKLSELSVNKALGVFSVTPNAGVVKLRIINPDTSAKYIWKVVTFAAAPATLDAPVVAEATDVTASGFTANWSAVANASGYRVLITSADTTIRATTESEVLSLAVDQLKPETEYTVKVAAIGDDAAFVGSVLSEGKVVTTANDPTAIDELSAQETKAHKVVINGQMYIRKNGELFNMTGTKVQ